LGWYAQLHTNFKVLNQVTFRHFVPVYKSIKEVVFGEPAFFQPIKA